MCVAMIVKLLRSVPRPGESGVADFVYGVPDDDAKSSDGINATTLRAALARKHRAERVAIDSERTASDRSEMVQQAFDLLTKAMPKR